jgi:hypothetical protein
MTDECTDYVVCKNATEWKLVPIAWCDWFAGFEDGWSGADAVSLRVEERLIFLVSGLLPSRAEIGEDSVA